MNNRTCTVIGCERKYRCSGYCGLHYDRMRRNGSTDPQEKVMRYCKVEGCGRVHFAKGYCKLHYGRVRITGDVGAVGVTKFMTSLDSDDVEGRILERCSSNGDCVEYRGHGIPSGYGVIQWRGKAWVVHRAMWTVKIGPIPTDDDWVIDHLCRNKRCVNIKHLEVVTRTENAVRGGGLAIAQGRNKQRSVIGCRRGHERTPENAVRNAKGVWKCNACRRDAWAKKSESVNLERRKAYSRYRGEGFSPEEAHRLAARIKYAPTDDE